MQTFKHPLVVTTKDRPLQRVTNDYKSIREGYEKLGGNPFGIKPLKPEPEQKEFDCG